MTTDAAGDPEAIDETTEEKTSDDADGTSENAATPVSDKTAKGERKHLPVWQESILLLGIALVLAIVIKTFFVQAFYIPSASMEPGLIKNDRILVQKVSYWFGGDPSRGDVVVFEDPGGWLTGEEPAPTGLAHVLSKVGLYPTGGHLVKRVIGTEGDVIECCDDQGRILVNGEPIDEPYLAKHHGKCAAALGGEKTEPGSAQSAPCDWSVGPI
ncbi:MAG: signal peptidase I, partial [Actinomycetota bacterium]|nr:signal peptidase I [Actinomycetota bacterium]